MKCALCKRPLFKPAATIGKEHIGRACAKKAGLLTPKHRPVSASPLSHTAADGQLDLGLSDAVPAVCRGHPYTHDGAKVIAVQVEPNVRVMPVLDSPPWIGPAYQVDPQALTRLPLRYLNGGMPA